MVTLIMQICRGGRISVLGGAECCQNHEDWSVLCPVLEKVVVV